MTGNRLRNLLVAAAVLTTAMLTTSCAPPPPAPRLVTPAGAVERTDGLVIDGERIADRAAYESAQAEGRLTLYSGYSALPEDAVTAAFTEDTGIPVDLVRLSSNRLYERISAEKPAGRLGADVVRISDPGFVDGLSQQGVFRPYTPPTADHLRADVRFDGGRYYRTFNPIYTFGYNTLVVEPGTEPRSWHDLTDPRWAGSLGIAQAGAGGSALALTRFQRERLGDDFLRAYAANDTRIFDAVGAELDGIARGEVSVGTVVVSSVNIARAENAPVQFVIPADGLTTYDYYTGVAADAPHRAAAELFMNWTMSIRGQNVFSQIGEYPVRTDVPTPVVLGTPLPDPDSPLVFRASTTAARENAADDLAFWNAQFGYNE
ncbi:extracellular solute-binding protein [Pseudonocardia sp. ICBG1122]|nr:extracellular solute-binding protein [Pseudonocardia pini]